MHLHCAYTQVHGAYKISSQGTKAIKRHYHDEMPKIGFQVYKKIIIPTFLKTKHIKDCNKQSQLVRCLWMRAFLSFLASSLN